MGERENKRHREKTPNVYLARLKSGAARAVDQALHITFGLTSAAKDRSAPASFEGVLAVRTLSLHLKRRFAWPGFISQSGNDPVFTTHEQPSLPATCVHKHSTFYDEQSLRNQATRSLAVDFSNCVGTHMCGD